METESEINPIKQTIEKDRMLLRKYGLLTLKRFGYHKTIRRLADCGIVKKWELEVLDG